MKILMYGLGGGEIIILLLLLIIPFFGYKVGSTRTIGGGLGLLIALFLNVVGLFIVFLFPKTDSLMYNNDVPDQLKKYKDLLDSGAITETEYKSQKERLLNKKTP